MSAESHSGEDADEIGKGPAETEVGTRFLARVLGVDERSIANYANEGMPKIRRGKFNLGAAVQWYINREVERARGGKGLNDLDMARQRHELAKARLAEIELARAEGAVIPIEVHRQRLTERLETVAGNVKGIHRFQPDIKAATTDESADALCDRMADAILAELHGLKDDIDDEPSEAVA